jgi:hypothetical protein
MTVEPPRFPVTRRSVVQALLAVLGFGAGGRTVAGTNRHPVRLLEAHVAGTHYAGLPVDYERALRAGLPLVLRREPGNRCDTRAVQVLDPTGRRIGYVPRNKNERLAALMDSGAPVSARVTRWKRHGPWLEIRFTVDARQV